MESSYQNSEGGMQDANNMQYYGNKHDEYGSPNNGGGMYDQEGDQYGDELDGDEDKNDGFNALNLQWVMGFNKDIDQGVHNLTVHQNGIKRNEIFYSSAHTGVIYDYHTKTQKLLQGHCNQITATTCSDDKRWIVTADSGDDSMLVVWDSLSGTPVRTYLNPHPNGIKTIDISMDNNYLVTLGNDKPQTISLWDWTNEKEEGPIVSLQYKYTDDFQNQHWVKFNPNDPTELASNGKERVLFLTWEQGSTTFQYYAPKIEKKDFSQKERSEAKFTKTVFIPHTDQAVTGTDAGDILVWDKSLIIEGIGEQNEKRLIKIVTFNQISASINILTTVHDQYLVCGNSDGSIRFYDFQFKVVAWFEDIDLNTIKSISFSKSEPIPATNDAKQEEMADIFTCSDFLVADDSALVNMLQSTLFEEINSAKNKLKPIFVGLKSSVVALAAHPKMPMLAIAGQEGFILLWDYLKRENPQTYNYDLYNRKEEMKEGGGKEQKERFTVMTFTPDGSELLIGKTNGFIEVLDPISGKYIKLTMPLKVSENSKNSSVTGIIVSPDGQYFAAMDSNCCVCLFKKDYLQGDPSKPMEWQFNGKRKTHEKKIMNIAFGESLDENGYPSLRLFSIGQDRRLFEYDIYSSTMIRGLEVKAHFFIEKEAIPTACIWYPKIDTKEDLLLTANNDYKMKVWNPSTQQSRRTCLGPTYGGEIVKLLKLDIDNTPDKYLIYSTQEKVIGLIKMPLDGNPNKTMGLIAHPKQVVDVCVSADGRYLFTCGGEDLAVNMWSIDTTPIDEAISLGGEGIEPFIKLIEGGREGQTFQDMKDFFYYSMIRSKNENTTKTRKLNGTVPLDELPNLMRAMGYYPTNQEVDNMKNEVKFSNFAETGQHVNAVDLNTFIRLFVNHRPVYGIGKNNIQEAFQDIMNALKTDEGYEGPLTQCNYLQYFELFLEKLVKMLEQEGEYMQIQELSECLNLLVGDSKISTALPEIINSEDFAENVLGFEEVEEINEEEDGRVEQQLMMATGGNSVSYMNRNGYQVQNDVIPEEDF